MEVKRDLGPNEKWYWISDSFSSSNISIMLSWNRKLSTGEIEKALHHCQDRIEVFCCVLDEKPRWIRLDQRPKVSITWCSLTPTPSNLYAVCEEECFLSLKTGECLLKVKVLQDNHSTGVVLTTPHYVADGYSLYSLGSIFVEGLGPNLSEAMTHPLSPALEALFPKEANGVGGWLRWIGTQFRTLWLEMTMKPFRIRPIPALELEGRRTKLCYFELNDELSKKITSHVARNREVLTVNDFVMAGMAQALASSLEVTESSMAIGCPINLGSLINKKNLFGPFVSAHLSYVPLKENSFLKVAQQIRQGFKKATPFLVLKPLALITKKSPKDSKKTFEKVTKLSPGCITLSNMGRVPMIPGTSFIGFGGSMNISGYMMLGCYSLPDGKLRFTLGWIEGVMTENQIKNFREQLILNFETASSV